MSDIFNDTEYEWYCAVAKQHLYAGRKADVEGIQLTLDTQTPEALAAECISEWWPDDDDGVPSPAILIAIFTDLAKNRGWIDQ